MNIAIITPLPPQHTGIADYAADLIVGLKQKHIHIDLFSNASISSFNQLTVYNITSMDTEILKSYDLIVYHMGNNIEFHLYMIELIKQYPGIVHLHDMVLHHVFAAITYAKGNAQEYFKTIEKWYGINTLNLVKKIIDLDNRKWENMPWDTEIVTDIPLFEEFIQYADSCIIHSEFVKNKIQKVFPNLRVYKVPQLYKMKNRVTKKTSKKIKFGIFGGVDPQKNVDTVIESFGAIIKENQNVEFSLVVVGGISKKCDFIKNLPEKLNLQDNVTITGRVEENEFMEYLNDIDVLIALRFPTMGETSAVVMRAMQLGIPAIVNDIGWYSELPDHIIKIPVQEIQTHLISELNDIFNDKNKLPALKKSSSEYAINNLIFENYIDSYLNVLQKEYSHKLNQYQYTKLAELIDEMKMNDTPLAQKMLNNIIDVF